MPQQMDKTLFIEDDVAAPIERSFFCVPLGRIFLLLVLTGLLFLTVGILFGMIYTYDDGFDMDLNRPKQQITYQPPMRVEEDGFVLIEEKPQPSLFAESTQLIERVASKCLEHIRRIFESVQHRPVDDATTEEAATDRGSFLVRNMISDDASNPSSNQCPATYNDIQPEHGRARRNAVPLDPVAYVSGMDDQSNAEYIRVKRSAAAQLQHMRQQMARCSRDANGNCEDIHLRYMNLVKTINAELAGFADGILHGDKHGSNEHDEHDSNESKHGHENKLKTLTDEERRIEENKQKEREKENLQKLEDIQREEQELERLLEEKRKQQRLDQEAAVKPVKMTTCSGTPVTPKPKMQLSTATQPVQPSTYIVNTISTLLTTPAAMIEPEKTNMRTTTIQSTTPKSIAQTTLPSPTIHAATLQPEHKNMQTATIQSTTLEPAATPTDTATDPTSSPTITKMRNSENDVITSARTFFGDGVYYTFPDQPPIHEDVLNGNREMFKIRTNKHLETESEVRQHMLNGLQQQQQQQQQQQNQVKTLFQSPQQSVQQNQPAPIINSNIQPSTPLNAPGSFGPSGPFLSLCEQLNRQQQQQSNFKPVAASNHPNFPSVQEFGNTNRQNIPLTGETSTASSQVMFNPGFSFSPTPVCFYPTPAMPSMYRYQPMMQPMWQMSPSQQQQMFQQQSLQPQQFVPQRLQNGAFMAGQPVQYPQFIQPNQINTGHGFARIPAQQPVYCTYLPENSPQHPQINQPANSAGHPHQQQQQRTDDVDLRDLHNIPTDSDIIYASYPNQMAAILNRTDATGRTQTACPSGQMACLSTEQCVPRDKWCNSDVDCLDSSDETACSCKSRLAPQRICDGYMDCPMGSDELGCFGCDKFAYSCYASQAEADAMRPVASGAMQHCYSTVDRCDGIENCLNGRDERDCSMIVRTVGEHLSYMVSYTEGYLHRNFKGKWYPVCDRPEQWANDACRSEIGSLATGTPIISYLNAALPGQYVQPAAGVASAIDLADPVFSDHCSIAGTNVILHVKCPPMRCGRTTEVETLKSLLRIRQPGEGKETDDKKTYEGGRRPRRSAADEEEVRIVGGLSSGPLNWPFVVAIYQDGSFHCGGVIYTSTWVITAAHCLSHFNQHYFEIRAGMLRRFSFAPMSQTVKVQQAIVHEQYDRHDMKNDIAMLRLESALLFNRWVKPICLPAPGRVTADANWVRGPVEGTHCIAVGWGSIRERGPDPDELREVAVPIIGRCKHAIDEEGGEICAGEKQGGRDACQGDSGGPLFCRSVSDANEWYLAGVVSHGEGCARVDEPGVYTRVALFLTWIEAQVTTPFQAVKQPRQECPGHRCVWGGGQCLAKRRRCDGSVDCLGGEDEINCPITTTNVMLGGAAATEVPTTTEVSDDGKVIDASINVVVGASTTRKNTAPETTTTSAVRHRVITDPPTHAGVRGSAAAGEINETDVMTTSDVKDDGAVTFVPLPTETQANVLPGKSLLPAITPGEAEVTTSSPPQVEPEQKELPNLNPIKHIIDKIHGFLPKRPTSVPATDQTEAPLPDATQPQPFEQHHQQTSVAPNNVPGVVPLHVQHVEEPPTPPAVPLHEHHSQVPIAPPTPVTTQKPFSNNNSGFEIPNKFVCRKIMQTINLINRCDTIRDCEDGTDEEECTCREYLSKNNGHRICDGHVDCLDRSDELDCLRCEPGQYACLLSRTCIVPESRCDGRIDCARHEDELDCVALTEGQGVVYLDVNQRPLLNYRGIVSRNSRGAWRVQCDEHRNFLQNGAEIVAQVCQVLGFSGYTFFNVTQTSNVPIQSVSVPSQTNEQHEQPQSKPAHHPHHPHHSSHPHHAQHPRQQNSSARSDGSDDNTAPVLPQTDNSNHPADHPYILQHTNVWKRETSTCENRPEITYREAITNVNSCFALYVECVPHATHQTTPGSTAPPAAIKPSIFDHLHKPFHALIPIIQPNKTPVVVVEFNETKHQSPAASHHQHQHHGGQFGTHWPWSASVYVEGRLRCVGVLLDRLWVLTEIGCMEGVRLEMDFVVVVLGVSKSFLNVRGPYEQVVRVNCVVNVEGGNTAMLYLEQSARFNREVLPTYLPDAIDVAAGKCFALSHNKFGQMHAIDVEQSRKVCFATHKCYVSTSSQLVQSAETERTRGNLHNIIDNQMANKNATSADEGRSDGAAQMHCDGEPATRCGVVVCTSPAGLYPDGFFSNRKGLCSFDTVLPVRQLSASHRVIQEIIDYPKCGSLYGAPACAGLRCRYGECLAAGKLCDGRFDCADGADEEAQVCAGRECAVTDMRCRNGRCVPKSKFCDHVDDCGDLSDEPKQCSCYTYLEATDARKICDGVRNCWDKSDENPLVCKCGANTFQCGESRLCVPKDFVCDKDVDCPNGEDEKYCYGLERPSNTNDGYAQVIEQSFGVWHTKCFPKPKEPTPADIVEICQKVGYRDVHQARGRIVLETNSTMIRTRNADGSIEISNGTYGSGPTKAEMINRLAPVRVHPELTLFMKPSRPIARPQQWVQTDEENCFRVEVFCE